MAQKRMLDKKISFSEKVADLPLGAQLLYTWMIPHADDLGLLQGSARTIKAQVIPMLNATLQDVTEWIGMMVKNELLLIINFEGKQYYYINHFEENQKIRKDINPYTLLPIDFEKETLDNWHKCEEIIKSVTSRSVDVTSRSKSAHSEPQVNIREESISKVNIREYKRRESSNGTLASLTDSVMQEIADNYEVPLSFVKSKYDDLKNYCASKGKAYKDYKAALRKWVKTDAIILRKEESGKSKLRIISPDPAWENPI